MSGEPLLIPLDCPRCGGELAGGERALVFLCHPCRLAVSMHRSPRPFPLLYAKPSAGAGSGETIYVPFWRLEGKASWRAPNEERRRAYDRLTPLGPLFFPAFWSPRAALYDNLTLRYALAPASIALEPGEAPVLEGVLDPADLPEMARLTWLAYLDRAGDVTGVECLFEPTGLAYVAVPFVRDGDHWVDGVLGINVPAGGLVR
ncbi:MAG: hypothetical protein ACP5VF_01415 [Acidobacteriota bacterium]